MDYKKVDRILFSRRLILFKYGSRTNVDALGPDRDIKVSSMRVGLKVEHRFNDLCWAYLAGGLSFARNLEIEDLQSNSLQEDDIDAAPFVQFGLNLRY